MPRKLTTSTARTEFADILNRVAYAGERVILHRHKKPVAALVPIEDLEILEQIEDRADLDEVRKRLKEPAIPWSKIKKELGL
jgi:prevent-host-death family protein